MSGVGLEVLAGGLERAGQYEQSPADNCCPEGSVCLHSSPGKPRNTEMFTTALQVLPAVWKANSFGSLMAFEPQVPQRLSKSRPLIRCSVVRVAQFQGSPLLGWCCSEAF